MNDTQAFLTSEKFDELKKELDNLNNWSIEIKQKNSILSQELDVLHTRVKDSEQMKKDLQIDIYNLSECKIDLYKEQNIIKLQTEELNQD